MSSTYTPFWARQSIRFLPFLWSQCKSGNYHFFTDKLCICGNGSYPISSLYIKQKNQWVKLGTLDYSTREDTQCKN